MEEMYRRQEPEVQGDILEESSLHEAEPHREAAEDQAVSGNVHISEEVIVELAKKVLGSIAGVQPASQSIASKFGIGKKTGDGVRVSVEDKVPQSVTVDVYLLVKFGLRIPDVAWDVQESIKKTLESYTGYDVKAVNVNIQGVYFEEKPPVAPVSQAPAPVSESEAPAGGSEAPVSESDEEEDEKIVLPEGEQP